MFCFYESKNQVIGLNVCDTVICIMDPLYIIVDSGGDVGSMMNLYPYRRCPQGVVVDPSVQNRITTIL